MSLSILTFTDPDLHERFPVVATFSSDYTTHNIHSALVVTRGILKSLSPVGRMELALSGSLRAFEYWTMVVLLKLIPT